MRPFAYVRADQPADAVRAFASLGTPSAEGGGPAFLAGGTTLVDLMKLHVMQPSALVDIGGLQASHGGIEVTPSGLRLGALARMSQVQAHPAVQRDFPVLAQSLQQSASPQLRNMATLGGNVLQRTRCHYFRDTAYSACNKRSPGSGCAALNGVNRSHALLGTSEHCIATYPGDFAQALIALDATVEITGPAGPRLLRFADLHLPDTHAPNQETSLRPGELILALRIPAGGFTRRSLYLKVRDRQSYAFALASAAVALQLGTAGEVTEARVALGGVATRPWRSHEAEAALRGRALTEATAAEAARAAFAQAHPRGHNAFKVELGQRTLVRALLAAARLEV